jgi:hypothetical protein
MADKKLLVEWFPITVNPNLLKEARETPDGKLILGPGIIQTADTENANHRIYPRELLNRELENYMKAIRERRSLGELDHPDRPQVNYENASHVITKAYWEGNNIMGEIEVLRDLPKGKILEGLVKAGIPIGISSRGVGSTSKRGGIDEVNDDYQIICWDVVSEPSTPNAYVFKEGKEFKLNQKEMYTKADRIFRALNNITRK